MSFREYSSSEASDPVGGDDITIGLPRFYKPPDVNFQGSNSERDGRVGVSRGSPDVTLQVRSSSVAHDHDIDIKDF